jgi:hypothetical protein
MNEETREQPGPRPRPPAVRRRLPAPRFADSPWVHAVIGAPVGASLAFLLQSPPRGDLAHLVVGAIAGAVLAVAFGALRPVESETPDEAEGPEANEAPCEDETPKDPAERSG